MNRSRLYFVEASKVQTYHITLIEGYLAAIVSSAAIAGTRDVVVAACRSLYSNIPAAIRERVTYEPIPVVDQNTHHVVRKSLMEFWVVLKYLLRKKRDDILFVSCIVPPALLLIEFVNRVLRKKNVFIVIHGEMEAILTAPSSRRSIGYWALRWLQARPRDSLIATVVIDDFIKAKLIAARPDKFQESSVFVAHHPVTATAIEPVAAPVTPSVCFIGYRTASKGFDRFERLAAIHPEIRFVAIGDGKREVIPARDSRPIAGNGQFLGAVSECSLALFPYTSGYDCSLSAAVLDALSTGVHVVATPRASFISLANEFGPEFVTIFRNDDELEGMLRDTDLVTWLSKGQRQRLSKLVSSKYGPSSVQRDFERICGIEGGRTAVQTGLT